MIINYWISNKVMTVGVSVTDGIITEAPPIVKKFIGQPIINLVYWMRNKKEFKMMILLKKIMKG